MNKKINMKIDKLRRELMKKGIGLIEEFKKFIARGNVVDMAVGVIVGGTFTSIVTSLNQDILTPILGIFGGKDFSFLKFKLGSEENAPVLLYGNFITAVINFLITSFIIFILVKMMNTISEKLGAKEEVKAAPSTKDCPYCKSKIDLNATRCPHCTSHITAQENTQDNAQENTQSNIQENTQNINQENIQDNAQENTQDNNQENIQDNTQENTQNNIQENTQENTQDNSQSEHNAI